MAFEFNRTPKSQTQMSPHPWESQLHWKESPFPFAHVVDDVASGVGSGVGSGSAHGSAKASAQGSAQELAQGSVHTGCNTHRAPGKYCRSHSMWSHTNRCHRTVRTLHCKMRSGTGSKQGRRLGRGMS